MSQAFDVSLKGIVEDVSIDIERAEKVIPLSTPELHVCLALHNITNAILLLAEQANRIADTLDAIDDRGSLDESEKFWSG